MGTIFTSHEIPLPANPLTFARNERIVKAVMGRRVMDDLNFVLARQRKLLGTHSVDMNNLPTAQANTSRIWRSYLHTGEEAKLLRLRFSVGIAPAGNASAVDPYCYWAVTEVGVGTVNSGEMHYGPHKASWGPDDIHLSKVDVDVSPDTAYTLALVCENYVQPVFASIHEQHPSIFPDDADAIVAKRNEVVVGGPIQDESHADMRSNGHTLWKHNGQHLFSWALDDDPDTAGAGVTVARTSATPANAFDQSQTSFATGDPGFKVQGQYSSPAHAPTVIPCVFAAYAEDQAETPDSTPLVRLIDANGTLCEITGWTGTAGWQTATFDLPGNTDLAELQIYIAGDGSDPLQLWAASAYMYST